MDRAADGVPGSREPLLSIALIYLAKRVTEEVMIAGRLCGTLIAWAKQLDRPDCASVLQKNLDEEKAADQKLTTLAESNINRKAA